MTDIRGGPIPGSQYTGPGKKFGGAGAGMTRILVLEDERRIRRLLVDVSHADTLDSVTLAHRCQSAQSA